jgi:16S rRNA (guanine527-N7)-methyltransferase
MRMDTARIAELLQPFLPDSALSTGSLERLQLYLDLLLRWNARVNLTAIRDPEEIVRRHFGESLFAGQVLMAGAGAKSLADIGSGAGFPGIPIKLWAPHLDLTLIESQNKKAVFLREVLRTLKLEGAQVYGGRAEDWGKSADIVTLRAVEQFERVLLVAANLVAPAGRCCLLIGSKQMEGARRILGERWTWSEPMPVPQSAQRVVAIAACSAEASS